MLLVLRYFGVTWDAALEVPAPPAPVWNLGRRERAPEDSVVGKLVESGGMPPKALTGIQATIATWLGDGHEAASEPIVMAEIKRIRGELNRLLVEAGDAPLDQDRVQAEIEEVILPLISTYVNRFARVRGVLPDPTQFTADWEIYIAHLLAGTKCRARYSYQLESPTVISGLVLRALEAAHGVQELTPRGPAESVPNSWNSLRTDGGVQQFDSEDEVDDEAMAEQMAGLQSAGPAQAFPGYAPAGHAPLFAGTRGPLRDEPHSFEAPQWSMHQAAPLLPLEGAETFDMAEGDAGEFADHDPYGSSEVGADSPGRESQSTPRRWISNVVGGTDMMLRSPLAFIVSLSLVILTPVITSVPYALAAAALFSTILWRHFTAMGTALVAATATAAGLMSWLWSEYTPVAWGMLAVVVASGLFWIWPDAVQAELPPEVRVQVASCWWRCVRRCGTRVKACCRRGQVSVAHPRAGLGLMHIASRRLREGSLSAGALFRPHDWRHVKGGPGRHCLRQLDRQSLLLSIDFQQRTRWARWRWPEWDSRMRVIELAMGINCSSSRSSRTHWHILDQTRAFRHRRRQQVSVDRLPGPQAIITEQQILSVAQADFLQEVQDYHSVHRQVSVSSRHLSSSLEAFRHTGRHSSQAYRLMGHRHQGDHPTSEVAVQVAGQALVEDLSVDIPVEAHQPLGQGHFQVLEVQEGQVGQAGQEVAVRTHTSVEDGAAVSIRRDAGWRMTSTGSCVDSPRVFERTCPSSTLARGIHRSLPTCGHWGRWWMASWT